MRGSRLILGALAAVVCVQAALLPVSTALGQGSSMLRDTMYEVSPEWSYNNFVFNNSSEKLSLTGIRIHERNGIAGKLLATAIVAVTLALGSSDREYLGSQYGYGYRVDYYRMKSSEEMAAEAAARSEAVDATADNMYQFDLRFYLKPDLGDDGMANGEGFSMTLYPFSWSFGDDRDWVFEFGFQWTSIYGGLKDKHIAATPSPGLDGNGNPLPGDSGKREFNYTNVGMPFRFVIPFTSFLYLDNQWDVNFLWLFGADEGERSEYDAPFRTTLVLDLGSRFFLRGGACLSGFNFGRDLGYQAEAGFRF